MQLAAPTGITVAEHLGAGDAIRLENDCICAFMGQTVTGPVGQATLVSSAIEYKKIFGGDSLSNAMNFAVEQFFGAGGLQLAIVRVINGATGARLTLPTSAGGYTLVARNPGSLENIRASVDIEQHEDGGAQTFTLVVQRLAGKQQRLVDQEIHRNISTESSSPDSLAMALANSDIATLHGTLDGLALLPTPPGHYLDSDTPGHDGRALSDYDLVGCEAEGTGLFALGALKQLDFLYAPSAVGMGTPGVIWQAAALRMCAERSALLAIDPPRNLAGLEALTPASASQNLMTYDQRPQLGKAGRQVINVAASLVGMLSEATSRRPAAGVAHLNRALARGLYLAPVGPSRSTRGHGLRLFVRRDGRLGFVEGDDGSARLAETRLRLLIQRAVKEGSRWLALTESGPEAWQRLEQQLGGYFDELVAAGLIESDTQGRSWFVQCNALTNAGADAAKREVVFLFGYVPCGRAQPEVYTVCQSLAGSELRSAAFRPVFRRPA